MTVYERIVKAVTDIQQLEDRVLPSFDEKRIYIDKDATTPDTIVFRVLFDRDLVDRDSYTISIKLPVPNVEVEFPEGLDEQSDEYLDKLLTHVLGLSIDDAVW